MKTNYSKKYASLISDLVDARKLHGITQIELSKKLKKPQSYVSKYENCERRLDIIEFIEITRLLGISAAKLIRKIEKIIYDDNI